MEVKINITTDDKRLIEQGLPLTLKGKKLTKLQKLHFLEKGFFKLEHQSRHYIIPRSAIDISSSQIKFDNYV